MNKITKIILTTFLIITPILGIMIFYPLMINADKQIIKEQLLEVDKREFATYENKIVVEKLDDYELVTFNESLDGRKKSVYYTNNIHSQNDKNYADFGYFEVFWNDMIFKWNIKRVFVGTVGYNGDIDSQNIIQKYKDGNLILGSFNFDTKNTINNDEVQAAIESIMISEGLSREDSIKYLNDLRNPSTVPFSSEEIKLQNEKAIQNSRSMSEADKKINRQSAIEIVAKFENLSDEEAAKKIDQTINSDGNITADELQELADSYSR